MSKKSSEIYLAGWFTNYHSMLAEHYQGMIDKSKSSMPVIPHDPSPLTASEPGAVSRLWGAVMRQIGVYQERKGL